MFKEADVIFSKIANSEPVKILAQNFSKLREALIGPEKAKAENIEKYIEAATIIRIEAKEHPTLTESEFLALVESTLKNLGMNGWDVKPVHEQVKHSDRFSYVSLQKNGGYNLWLQIQNGQKIIFYQRSFSDVKGVM